MDDRYTIDTPENIEFAYDIAGIGSRFLAAIIDTLLIGGALLILGIIIAVLGSRTGVNRSAALSYRSPAAVADIAKCPPAERPGLQLDPGIPAAPRRAWARRARAARRAARQWPAGAAGPATGRRCRAVPSICCRRVP